MRYYFLFFIAVVSSLWAGNTYICKNVANIYVIPEEISEVCSQAIYATAIEILDENNDWFLVKTSDQYQGWILKKNIILRDDLYPNIRSAKVKSLWAHIHYVEDTTPYPPIITLPFESKVEVLSAEEDLSNRWIKVRLIDGSIGFAQSRDFDFDDRCLSLDEMIEFSMTFLNIPYFWGGNSSFGYDCSGFSQMLYRQMGIFIDRDAHNQALDPNFEKVCFEDMEKGDLIFFGSNGIDITHVGMYLGDGKIIHAGTKNLPPKVQVTEISFQNSDHEINIKNFITARRKKENP